MICEYCGYDMGSDELLLCPKCWKPTKYYDKSVEKKLLNELQKAEKLKKKRSILYDYSDEELLALNLYPQDETYKMSLISRILGRK